MKKIIPVILLIFLTSCQSKLDTFAQCLTDQGAIFYGSLSCEHCKEQKAFFEDSSEYLNYVECDKYAKNSNYKACKEAKINSYPTWIFSDGSYLIGKQSFPELAEKTSCVSPL